MMKNILREDITEQFGKIIEVLQDGYILADREGNIIDVNSAYCDITGYDKEELLSMNLSQLRNEKDIGSGYQEKFFSKVVKNESTEFEIQHITKDGRKVDLSGSATVTKVKGEIYIAEFLRNVTKRKEEQQAKKKLEESEQRFKSLFEHNPNPVYYFDLEGNFQGCNDKMVTFTGYSREEILSLGFEDFVLEEDLERTWHHFKKAAEGTPGEYEILVEVKDGIKDIRVTKFPKYEGDDITGVFGILQDITEEQQAKKKLKKNEQRWQHLVENNPQPVQVTVDGEIVFINQAGATLYGVESPKEITGISVFEFSYPGYEEKIRERKHKLENGIDVDNIHEHKIVRVDGESRFVEVHSIPIEYQGKKAIQTVLTDITERKKQKKIIQDSLQEKEVLLKEIHHRVKNNMAVVSGLLQLQAMNTDNDQLADILKESQLRIYSMAMIHEKLYQTETLSDINVEKYIKELVEVIKDTVIEENMDVSISYNIDDLTLDINQAIPCALILNELVVNCFKHAFSEVKQGQITIILQEKDGQVRLKVRDNGKGLPEDFDINEFQTLGMSLIQTLTAQLEGEVGCLENAEGTEFIVEFSVTE